MATITHGNAFNRSRYYYDFNLKGFAQLDTHEDASYYGNWANVTTLEIFTYAEGDTIHIKCDTVQEFAQEIRKLVDFHNRGRDGFYGIDPGAYHTPEIMQPWINAGLQDLIQ
jgi:hypothetical protein